MNANECRVVVSRRSFGRLPWAVVTMNGTEYVAQSFHETREAAVVAADRELARWFDDLGSDE